MRATLPPFPCTLLALLLVGGPIARPQDLPSGFAETFALAADREQALELLVPGSAGWYRYRCLQQQEAGELDAAARTLYMLN